MKAVTANRLTDGRVVYLGPDGLWVDALADAALFNDDAGEPALAAAGVATGDIADAYLIDADTDGRAAGRAALRETIRATGPTVRRDLGKQAGAS